MKKNIFILIMLLITFGATAQINLKAGSIEFIDGKSVQGFIDYRNWGVNPADIRFYEQKNDAGIQYFPSQIKSFTVNGDVYRSAWVAIETSPNEISRLSEVADFILEYDTVFLLRIVEGEISLWSYHKKEGKFNYYLLIDNSFELLKYKSYKAVNKTQHKFVHENKLFIGQLTIYLSDCNSIDKKIKKARYSGSSLAKLIEYYNRCAYGIEGTQLIQSERLHLDFGLLAGFSISSINFKSSTGAYKNLKNSDFQNSTNPSGGLSLDLIFPRNRQKWILRNEFIYSGASYEGTYTEINNNTREEIYTELEFSWLKINTMLRYSYPLKNARIFANIGISNGFVLNNTNYQKREWQFYDDLKTTEGPSIAEVRKYEQAILFGIGARVKNFSLEARFSSGNGMSGITSLNSHMTRFYFFLAYTL